MFLKSFPNKSLVSGETPGADEKERPVKFPVKLKHRGRVLARIYAQNAKQFYRLYWRIGGKSRFKEFRTYSAAKQEGDALVKQLAEGSQVTALTPKQAGDALAALQRLEAFFQLTGRCVSLLAHF